MRPVRYIAISVPLTTENSDDLKIRIPDGPIKPLKVTLVNSSCVISY